MVKLTELDVTAIRQKEAMETETAEVTVVALRIWPVTKKAHRAPMRRDLASRFVVASRLALARRRGDLQEKNFVWRSPCRCAPRDDKSGIAATGCAGFAVIGFAPASIFASQFTDPKSGITAGEGTDFLLPLFSQLTKHPLRSG